MLVMITSNIFGVNTLLKNFFNKTTAFILKELEHTRFSSSSSRFLSSIFLSCISAGPGSTFTAIIFFTPSLDRASTGTGSEMPPSIITLVFSIFGSNMPGTAMLIYTASSSRPFSITRVSRFARSYTIILTGIFRSSNVFSPKIPFKNLFNLLPARIPDIGIVKSNSLMILSLCFSLPAICSILPGERPIPHILAINAPMLEPDIISIGMRFFSNTFKTPMCARPNAAPLPNARPKSMPDSLLAMCIRDLE